MPLPELIAELDDISFWHDPFVSLKAHELLGEHESGLHNDLFRDRANDILRVARQRHKTYHAVWLPGGDEARTFDGQRLIISVRPGWGKDLRVE